MTTKIKLASNVSDVDLTTTAPTNGQGLIYNSTSSKWVPGAAGGGVTVYATIDDLPLSGVSTGSLALVDSTNKLYLWMDTGWYNIATANIDPSITAGNNTPYLLALDGTPTVITLTASDPEGIPLTWSYEVTSGSLTNGGGTTATVSNDGSGQFTVTPTTTEAYAGEFSLTFKASDGVNLGTTVAAFTLAFRVVDSKYTSLLVKALASGANSTFVDSSTNGFTITKNGDVTQGTFSPFSQPDGAWSNYFDGTGDYLSVPSAAAIQFGAGDFTMETWVFPTSISGGQLFFRRTTVSAIGMIIQFSSGNVNLLAGDTNTSGWEVNLTSTSAVIANTWSHIAVTRSGSTWTIFINGTSAGTATASFTIAEETGDLKIGDGYSGYMSNWRVVKGTAITPPSGGPADPLEDVTGTGLLTCQSNRFVDNSTNGFAITVAGNTAVSPFGPFDRLAYDPAIHGGGAYFDGSGDYLSATYTPASMDWWSTDYTLEAWVYPTTFAGWSYLDTAATKPVLIGNKDAGGTTNYWCFGLNTSGNVYFAYWNGTPVGAGTTSTATLNAWNHIALVNNGGALTLYLNGVGTSIGNVAGTPLSSTSYPLSIGAANNTYINGHVANIRMIKGTALYTSTFTPPTAPLTAVTNTSLLLNCVNADIIDNDSKNNLKLVGNTAASATQTKYAARSVYFDGVGDYATPGATSAIDFGTGDFTIEAWIYTNSVSGIFPIFGHGTSNSAWWSWYLQNSQLQYYDVRTGVDLLTPTATFVTGQWYHIAVVRSGSTFTQYINGVADADTGSSATAMTPYAADFHVGRGRYSTDAYYFNGYIEDFRITKGLARYPTNPFPTDQLLG